MSLHIGRAPLRLTLGGGGTDLPGYFNRFGGYALTASINKYITVIASPTWDDRIRLAYSKFENVAKVDEVEHRIIKATLRHCRIYSGIEIHSMSDVPSGTGLGSSSAFTIALLRALYAYKREEISNYQLAEDSHYIESTLLGAKIGKQDQYASAFGGFRELTFHQDDRVDIESIPLSWTTQTRLTIDEPISLFYIGQSRDSSVILDAQVSSMSDNANSMHQIKYLGVRAHEYLTTGELDSWGHTLHLHWLLKRGLVSGMTSNPIDEAYQEALDKGAIGGKLIGAGGNGFLMFYTHSESDKKAVTEAMIKRGYFKFPFKFEF